MTFLDVAFICLIPTTPKILWELNALEAQKK